MSSLRQLPSLSSPQGNSETVDRSLDPTDTINESPKQRKLISKILAPALKLWLRSQLDAIDNLQLTLTGGNRQILSGSIPAVLISASHAIYQGIHLSQIFLEGRGIRFNIGETLKGHPLHLIDPVPIEAKLNVSQTDLNNSLKSALFKNAVQEFLGSWLQSQTQSCLSPLYPLKKGGDKGINFLLDLWQIDLGKDELTVTGMCRLANEPKNRPLRSAWLKMGIEIRHGHQLSLVNPKLQIEGEATIKLDNFSWDLGSEVIISELTLIPDRLMLQGQFLVTP